MSKRRVPMTLTLTHQEMASRFSFRSVVSADATDLAILLFAAFRGTIDDDGEGYEDAKREIEKTFAGDYGRLLTPCSFVIENGDVIQSACLISWYEPTASPFVVFTMTRPEYKHQGMGRFLLRTSINALIDQGYRTMTLIVTDGNVPAQRLYRSLGFEPFDPSDPHSRTSSV